MSEPGYTFDFGPSGKGEQIAAIIVLVLTTLVHVPVFSIIYIRRKNRFLEARKAVGAMILGVNFYLLTWVTCLSFFLGKEPFCWPMFIFYGLFMCFSLFYILNVPTLVVTADLNAAKLARGQLKDESAFVWRLSRFISFRAKLIYVAVLSPLFAGGFAALYLLGNIKGDCIRVPLLFFTGMTIVFILFLIPLLPKFLKLRDPFFLKVETIYAVFITSPVLVVMIIYSIYPQLFPEWFDYRWNTIFFTWIYFILNVLFPALLTFSRFVAWMEGKAGNADDEGELDPNAAVFALKKGLDIFRAVLQHPVLLEAFTQFMVKEWCVENILFYQQVNEFQKVLEKDPILAKQLGAQIVREYVIFGAPLEVNIDASTRRKILADLQRLDAPPANVFHQAEKEVLIVMEQSSFARWRLSQEFKDLLRRVIDESSNNGRGSKVRSQAMSNQGPKSGSEDHIELQEH